MLEFDHIAIASETLEDGVSWVKECLGVEMPKGGEHPLMGTHNHLMQLGDQAFLEVISIDPKGSVERKRWFELDHFRGPPRLQTWIARCAGIEEVVDNLSVDVGTPLDVTRGDLHWKLSVRDSGTLPFEGLFPSIIEWPKRGFPVPNMPDLGCALVSFHLEHPRAEELQGHLDRLIRDERIKITQASTPKMRCEFQTPTGLRWLG